MSNKESLIDQHLRKIIYDGYDFEEEPCEKTKTTHIIFTVLTQINQAIQSLSESTSNSTTEVKPIGSSSSWFLLRTILRTLAEGVNIDLEEGEKIDLIRYQSLFNNITNHLRSVR